ncbi:MAG: recombinase RecT [Thiocapsa sp.]|uniref:recombinase RecT n=1 Tax=Thiocapsa sp. TaxID=2024551 RepID=UPI001BCC2123|nr:recombinase RecT [Thiocapsa sp.]QVL47006.1 MAG: recombinase RecT [Thiocapsa sp.]
MATKPRTQPKPAVPQPSARLAISDAVLAELNLDHGTWRVLTESIFPSAKTAEGILLAVRYCQARGLDVLKRPVHVVPMYSRALGHEVETVWPGINEVQITAARTGQYAGIDPARFGPETTRVFQGRAKTENGWQDARIELTYPAWAEVTVYRLVNGVRCAFTETVFWEETYARMAGGEVPTAMWIKRPRGQLLKCAKAASLRAAFPEEASYTAEEMAGKTIEPDDVVAVRESVPDVPAAEPEPEPEPAPPTALDAAFKQKLAKLIERAAGANAWAQAEDYLHERFTGEQLGFALDELGKAAAASVQAQAA